MNNPEIIEKNKAAVILLAIIKAGENNQNSISFRGTGFITSKDGQFVTCAHVLKEIPENEKKYLKVMVPSEGNNSKILNYKNYDVRLLKIDEENDIATMEIISQEKFVIVEKFGDSENVQEGDEVMILGYPLALELFAMGFGITLNASKCIISSIKRRGVDGSLHFFMVDTHINSGSSGSPVFLSSTGEVIGIASGKIEATVQLPDKPAIRIPANMGICGPSKYITKLLN